MQCTRPLLFAAALSIAGCGGSDPVAEDANASELPSLDNVAGGRDGVPSADGAPPQSTAASPTPSAPTGGPVAVIPATLHGRWGLTPGDCTATRGDDKGKLIVSAGDLRFYESRAVPVSNVETSSDSYSANFAFTGEGQSWTKYQALSLDDDRLIRTESSPMASFTYARCR